MLDLCLSLIKKKEQNQYKKRICPAEWIRVKGSIFDLIFTYWFLYFNSNICWYEYALHNSLKIKIAQRQYSSIFRFYLIRADCRVFERFSFPFFSIPLNSLIENHVLYFFILLNAFFWISLLYFSNNSIVERNFILFCSVLKCLQRKKKKEYLTIIIR